jgi:hypothetical protein
MNKHINNVFAEGELQKDSTVANFATVQTKVSLFGASLKDLGKKWFAFSKSDKNSVENLLKAIENE